MDACSLEIASQPSRPCEEHRHARLLHLGGERDAGHGGEARHPRLPDQPERVSSSMAIQQACRQLEQDQVVLFLGLWGGVGSDDETSEHPKGIGGKSPARAPRAGSERATSLYNGGALVSSASEHGRRASPRETTGRPVSRVIAHKEVTEFKEASVKIKNNVHKASNVASDDAKEAEKMNMPAAGPVVDLHLDVIVDEEDDPLLLSPEDCETLVRDRLDEAETAR
ncbi:hypothetical protein EJB05_07625, partial [Eragrostis curvula]